MRVKIHSALTLVTLLALAASTAASAGAQVPERAGLPPVVSLPPEVDAVLRRYEEAWGNHDAAALAALFTDDGFVLTPGHPPRVGRAAIAEAYAGLGGPLFLRAYAYSVEGDVGYIIGGYTHDPSVPEGGKFVLAIRRSSSGEWLIAADMDNGNSG